MIQIYIDNKIIDLDNTNISLQKEFKSEIENIPTDIEYSYTISIPCTLRNKEIFGFIDVFDVANKFSRIYNAELYVDETLILSGKFKISSIEDEHYKGNLYNPKKKNISDILGDRQLSDINPHMKPMNTLGDYDKTNNVVYGLSSDEKRLPTEWSESEFYNQITDNHVIYPYTLYGVPLNNADTSSELDIYTQNLKYGEHTISDSTIFPSFNVLSVLKDIFATEGYNVKGNIFDGTQSKYFNNLYQTFQYPIDDYNKNRETTFYLDFEGTYSNFIKQVFDIERPLERHSLISPTLQLIELWSQDSWHSEEGDDIDHDGKMYFGVDNPLSCGYVNNYKFKINSDDRKMFKYKEGKTDSNAGVIVIPKSGWYRIKADGKMNYPYHGSELFSQDENLFFWGDLTIRGGMSVGGTTNEANNTDLSEQPFEFQIKRGVPAENPQLYSFNSFIPCQPTEFIDDNSVLLEREKTYIKIGENASQRRYGKNGGVTYINNYSGFQTNDFLCGARLGGAWFSSQWEPRPDCGWFPRWNRYMSKGAGLALPDVTKTPRVKHYENEQPQHIYKNPSTLQPKVTGDYLLLDTDRPEYEYAEKTAQIMVKKDSNALQSSYTNFGGYNELKKENGVYSWDTTTNFGKISYEGAGECSASTKSHYEGEWNIDTVVWLEQGDTLYMEILMPVNRYGYYESAGLFTSSCWVMNEERYVNATELDYHIYIGYLNARQDWKPQSGDGIKSWDDISKKKLTNVNQFLPSGIKCNDYLNKFLKTFNLQLTQENADTFRIDSISDIKVSGNIIDIDGMVDANDAEFKPLSSPSSKQLGWKIDQSETGYKQGNQSPYRTEDYPWYESGYTGNIVITNETNTSGSIEKTESQWSYSWYKDIKFINAPYSSTPTTFAINVICGYEKYKDGATFANLADEKLETNKTSRLFFIIPLEDYLNTYQKKNYIEFKYDEHEIEHRKEGQGGSVVQWHEKVDDYCNLVLPTNFIPTKGMYGSLYKSHLDYGSMPTQGDTSITDKFFDFTVDSGYQIDIPITLSNQDYANTKNGTLYKLNDGLFKVKSIQGHDVNMEDASTLSLLTLK